MGAPPRRQGGLTAKLCASPGKERLYIRARLLRQVPRRHLCRSQRHTPSSPPPLSLRPRSTPVAAVGTWLPSAATRPRPAPPAPRRAGPSGRCPGWGGSWPQRAFLAIGGGGGATADRTYLVARRGALPCLPFRWLSPIGSDRHLGVTIADHLIVVLAAQESPHHGAASQVRSDTGAVALWARRAAAAAALQAAARVA